MHPHIHKFKECYGNHKLSTVQNLFIFVASLIKGKTVNLYDLKDEVGIISEKYNSQSESHYRRLTRFFTQNAISNLWSSVLSYGLDLISKDLSLCYLDATEWKIGKFKLHILLLAVDYNGVAVPIYFKIYCHKGVLSEDARIDFLLAAHECCTLTDATIIADREFIGDSWFSKHTDLGINFVFRLRKGQYKENLAGNRSYSELQKRAIKKGKASSVVWIDNEKYRLWIVKNSNESSEEPLIFLLTNILNKRNIPNLYALRWKIESLFKHLKTNGYNLEDLRMTNLDKIRLLIAVLTIAYIMAILTALEERKKKPIKKKISQNGNTFDSVSVFKQGQSILKQAFINLRHFLEIIQYLNVHCTSQLPKNILFVQ